MPSSPSGESEQHQHRVDVAIVLVADTGEAPNVGETEAAVQFDGRTQI
jgi:hypothetical protein